MRLLVKISVFFAFIVIVLGAFTRLTEAGLGCPDWPGCYGFLKVPSQEEHVQQAELRFPDAPVEHAKAWNEMVHRYFAGTLGLLILTIAIISWVKSRRYSHYPTPVKLPTLLLGLVIFQAALGMWTVTMNLQPLIVMGHLLGGFSVISLLYLLSLRLSSFRLAGGDPELRRYRGLAFFTLLVVIGQIALGGWVAANYAAVACTELPFCEGNWTAQLDFAGAFSIPEADTYQYGAHDYNDRMTMHVMHRVGAIITFLVICTLLFKCWRKAKSHFFRRSLIVIGLLLSLQILLGISNVVFQLPLWNAVAHNAVGALLLLSLVALNYNLSRKA
ncbi:COX15/CtaA family protein [Idiomarina loihiensis]|uniref:COX15/CtaA family protein n=1 Tax=Idiomarina TaxID=135575 RepID=UPI000D7169E3|nr:MULTISPECIES: COX15/CtaA family protein [Idiomarina]PWW40527.1 cytochrome c oxidase assembly protein subunit 15 [Idiomarina loihiensis]TDO48165.1 cytochrome c oxidase assembly protein subunit 15 [Idiomarina sp. 017G]TDP50218.1 cytochrome c oxidase assembly protein subunit 15 [Idiomarina loihiensis]TDS24430.1 cytochrome c oxidase assembly protein subunit 15 [Idiomarina sp. H2]|tara:strand:+ start:1945 stop:2934 length:990 start_codon:yes stop_codon:yes gene_type:complete